MPNQNNDKSLEQWLWDAACSIRGAKEAAKYKDFILPLIFTKRLCDVFDDELNRIAKQIGGRAKAFKLVKRDKKLVRFYVPLEPADPDEPVWSVIRKLADKIGETLTTHLRAIADENPKLKGIIDRVDFNATTHGQRDISDDRLSALIERISQKRLGLEDVEPDIIGKSYMYLIRKFAEGSGQSAGEFYTPGEVGMIMALIMDPEPGMHAYDPTCGSAGLLIACEHVTEQKVKRAGTPNPAPLKLFGQEYIGTTWAMANMNLIIHDLEGVIEIGDTFKSPKFRVRTGLQTFDRAVANPMWNQDWYTEKDYDADEFGRFPKGAGCPGKQSADWGWVQHILASLNENGRAAIVLDTGAASRGSGTKGRKKERDIRKWFVVNDLIEGVIQLPSNLFYNTPGAGIILFLSRSKPASHRGRLLLLNASLVFEKGDPKNLIPETGIELIAQSFRAWREEEGFVRVVSAQEIAANDYNIAPSHYIRTDEVDHYRPLSAVIEYLRNLDGEIYESDKELRRILDSGLTATVGSAWETLDFPGSLVRTTISRRNQINTSEIEPHGRYPVVDQGQEFVAGYSDDEARVVKDNLPVVVFGDHTRCFKFVDFPFILGADGTKVLKPNTELFDPKFYYFALLSLDIPSRGYNRHYALLKEKQIPRPDKEEQQRIAGVLSAVETAIQLAERRKQGLEELFRVLLQQLMGQQLSVRDAGVTDP